MKNKIVKVFIIILNIIVIASLFSNALAAGAEDFSGNLDGVGDAKDSAVKILSSVLNVIRTVGAVVAIAILIVLACKYIIASAGDRADITNNITTAIVTEITLSTEITVPAEESTRFFTFAGVLSLLSNSLASTKPFANEIVEKLINNTINIILTKALKFLFILSPIYNIKIF